MEDKLTVTDKWWSSLKVTEKERIARKITDKETPYPECTAVWENLPEHRKQSIMLHVSDKHGHLLKDWDDGKPFTD